MKPMPQFNPANSDPRKDFAGDVEKFTEMEGPEFEEYLIPPVENIGWDKEEFREACDNKEHRKAAEIQFKWFLNKVGEEYGGKALSYITRTVAREFGIRTTRSNKDDPSLTKEMIIGQELQRVWQSVDEDIVSRRFKLIFDLIKNHQPENWDPENPVRKIEKANNRSETRTEIKELQEEIENKLSEILQEEGNEEDEDVSVNIYTTSDTPLDHGYGTDFVVEYGGVTLAIDVTKQTDYGKTESESGKLAHIRWNKAEAYLTPEIVDPHAIDHSRVRDKFVSNIANQLIRKMNKQNIR